MAALANRATCRTLRGQHAAALRDCAAALELLLGLSPLFVSEGGREAEEAGAEEAGAGGCEDACLQRLEEALHQALLQQEQGEAKELRRCWAQLAAVLARGATCLASMRRCADACWGLLRVCVSERFSRAADRPWRLSTCVVCAQVRQCQPLV